MVSRISSAESFKQSMNAWQWLHDHDIPNSVSAFFSLVVWPLALFAWSRRSVSSVPGLEVCFDRISGTINGESYDGVRMRFINNTGSVVYLSGARVLRCTTRFPVHPLAHRDHSAGSRELLFRVTRGGLFDSRQVILQTEQIAETSLAAASAPDDDFFRHIPNWFRKHFGLPKYFSIRYLAVSGSRRYRVSSSY